MNNITIAGALGKDAEMRYLQNGDAVASFSVADSQGKDKPTIWWNCSIFGKRTVSLGAYLKKGQAVTVSGTITEREWTDKKGGKRKSMDVRVNDIALQGGRANSSPKTATAKSQGYPSQRYGDAAKSGFDDMHDDLPPF